MLYRSMIAIVFVVFTACAPAESDVVTRRGAYGATWNYEGLQVPFPIKVWVGEELSPSYRAAVSDAFDEINQISGQQVFVPAESKGWGYANVVIGVFDNDAVYAQISCAPVRCELNLERVAMQDFIAQHGDGKAIVEHELFHVLGYRGDDAVDPMHDVDGLMGGPVTDANLRPEHIEFLGQLKSYQR